MDIVLNNVRVTNWSKDPLLKLQGPQQQRLSLAIDYSRQIVSDACDMLQEYQRKQVIKSVDRQMAKDYFGSQAAAKEALAKYFGLNLSTPADQLKVATIVQKFQLVKQGISGRFDIVVGNIHDMDDIKSGLRGALSEIRDGGTPKDAWRHITFIRVKTEGWVDPTASHAQNRIHLNISAIDNLSAGKIARVIVHEASHKFANTDDVTVTDASGDDHIGYKWDGLKNNATGFTNLENNADSFAWAGRLMWKRKRHLASGT
jgi:hypothetical protein